MFENLSDLLSKASTKGDVAVVLVAGTAGLLLDAGLNIIGFLSPGTVGVTFATGSLGLKKTVEAAFAKKIARKQENEQNKSIADHLDNRINIALRFLKEKNNEKAIKILEQDYQLYKSNLLSKEDFENCLKKIVDKIREEDRTTNLL